MKKKVKTIMQLVDQITYNLSNNSSNNNNNNINDLKECYQL